MTDNVSPLDAAKTALENLMVAVTGCETRIEEGKAKVKAIAAEIKTANVEAKKEEATDETKAHAAQLVTDQASVKTELDNDKAQIKDLKKQVTAAKKAVTAEERAATKAEKVAEKEAAKAEKAAAREASKMPEQNGVRRPRVNTTCAKVWDHADNLSRSFGQPTPIKDLLEACRAEGINDSTIKTQYSRWRSFNGVAGRVTRNVPEVAKEDGSAEAPAE